MKTAAAALHEADCVASGLALHHAGAPDSYCAYLADSLTKAGYAIVRSDELAGLADAAIFDLPLGNDVTYSRGYSAGLAAARDAFREAMSAALEGSL